MATKPTGRPDGRPPKYRAHEHPDAVRRLAGEGKTGVDIAEALGIHISTLMDWRTNHPDFSAAWLLGVEDSCDRVERALFKRAIGARVVVRDAEGRKHIEAYPPETKACMSILTNRRPRAWRDRKGLELSGPGGTPIHVITNVPASPEDPAPAPAAQTVPAEPLESSGEFEP